MLSIAYPRLSLNQLRFGQPSKADPFIESE